MLWYRHRMTSADTSHYPANIQWHCRTRNSVVYWHQVSSIERGGWGIREVQCSSLDWGRVNRDIKISCIFSLRSRYRRYRSFRKPYRSLINIPYHKNKLNLDAYCPAYRASVAQSLQWIGHGVVDGGILLRIQAGTIYFSFPQSPDLLWITSA